MTAFTYKGRNGEGGLVDGVIDAVDIDAAADTLLGSRITPIELNQTCLRIKLKWTLRAGWWRTVGICRSRKCASIDASSHQPVQGVIEIVKMRTACETGRIPVVM